MLGAPFNGLNDLIFCLGVGPVDDNTLDDFLAIVDWSFSDWSFNASSIPASTT